MRKLLAIISLLLWINPIQAQQIGEKDLGAWYMFFGNIRITDNLSIHAETQWRQFQTLGEFQQTLSRVGLNYHINANNILTSGYGFIETKFPYSKSLHFDEEISMPDEFSSEHRIWEQYVQNHQLGRLYLDHRYRFEQRFMKREGVSTFHNRTRYKIGVAIPITTTEMQDKALFFYWYDEIFLIISDKPFNQNRFYTGLGYNFNSALSAKIGYLWWYTTQLHNRLQFSVGYNLDLRKTD